MKINKSYKIELNPNNKQKTYLEKSFGCARFAYNWGLNRRIELYEKEKKLVSAIDQHKELCKLKKSEFPWMYEVSKCIPQIALRDLEMAFKNFFRGLKQRKNIGFPKFKSKHKSKDSFRISLYYCKIFESHIRIPHCSKIILKEKNYIPLGNVKYNSVTISKEANRYFASVQCEEEEVSESKKSIEIIGIRF